jgi:uncharacterized DUF497 family protein
MDITYDFAKDEINLQKQGFSLLHAAKLDWSSVMAAVDARKDYLELREIGFGVIEGRLFCVVLSCLYPAR